MMVRGLRRLLAVLTLILLAAPSAARPVRVGTLANGLPVDFTHMEDGFALAIGSRRGQRIVGTRPVRIELYRNERDIRTVNLPYRTVSRSGDTVTAGTDLAEGDAVLHVEDRYRIVARILRIDRTVRIAGAAPGIGFTSGLVLTAPIRPLPQRASSLRACSMPARARIMRPVRPEVSHSPTGAWRCARMPCPPR